MPTDCREWFRTNGTQVTDVYNQSDEDEMEEYVNRMRGPMPPLAPTNVAATFTLPTDGASVTTTATLFPPPSTTVGAVTSDAANGASAATTTTASPPSTTHVNGGSTTAGTSDVGACDVPLTNGLWLPV